MEQRMHIRGLAEKLRTSPRAIRFYEEKGLISPAKDPNNHYRLFSEKDAWRLQTILSLREVGMPVRSIKRVLEAMDEGENSGVRRYLELQRSAMFFEWIRIREMIRTIDGMIDSLENRTSEWEDIYRLADRHVSGLNVMAPYWSTGWNGLATLTGDLVYGIGTSWSVTGMRKGNGVGKTTSPG